MTDAPPSSLPGIAPVLPHEAADEVGVIERAFAAGPYGHLPKSAERRAFERDTAGRAASGAVLGARRDGRVVATASVLRAATPYSRVAVPGESRGSARHPLPRSHAAHAGPRPCEGRVSHV